MAAVEPLCLCGIRGCPLADQHLVAFVQTNPPRRTRNGRRTRKS